MTKKLVNITEITQYLYCPRKLWLKKVKGIREKPNKVMINGMIKHKALELFNINEKNFILSINSELNKEQLQEKYESLMKTSSIKAYQSYYNIASKFKINLTTFLAEFLPTTKKEVQIRIEPVLRYMKKGFFGEQLWENLKPKYKAELSIISDKFGLKGRIDRVEFSDNLIPYEVKTRSKDIVYESDKLQLAGYALLLQDKFNQEIKKGILETKKNRKEIDLDEELKNKVLDIAEKIRNLMKEPSLPSNFNKCKYCSLTEYCS